MIIKVRFNTVFFISLAMLCMVWTCSLINQVSSEESEGKAMRKPSSVQAVCGVVIVGVLLMTIGVSIHRAIPKGVVAPAPKAIAVESNCVTAVDKVASVTIVNPLVGGTGEKNNKQEGGQIVASTNVGNVTMRTVASTKQREAELRRQIADAMATSK